MKLFGLLAVLLVVAVSEVHGVIVSKFDGACDPCNLKSILFPSNSEYILQTGDDNLWRTIDEGHSWTNILQGVDTMQSYSNLVDSRTIIVDLYNGTMVATRDAGDTFTPIQPPVHSTKSSYTLHATRSGWMLLYYCFRSCTIYYTKNLGETWNQGPEYLALRHVIWGHDDERPDLIFAIKNDNNFYCTNDYGRSWILLVENAVTFELTDNYLYVEVVTSSGDKQLYSSSSRVDPSHTIPQNYWLDEFPDGSDLPDLKYQFLDDSSRSEFIGVTHSASYSWGNLYSSDFDGEQFVLSLEHLATQNNEQTVHYDFSRFEGLNGMYVTNAYSDESITDKRTHFTYDNGGDWKLLTAPTLNYTGQPTNCDIAKNCSLHLHGQLSWYFGDVSIPYFYTSPNAIGLMVGVGNLGTSLAADAAQASTWLTRDAGVTWAQIFPEPTVYDFADHGGILAFATILQPTNRIYYSFDEGKTSSYQNFTTNPIYVDNIFTEPTGTGRRFMLFGHSSTEYLIYELDFSDSNLPICTEDDYELWTPTNGDNIDSQCFMGRMTWYQRRKQDSKCYNDRDTDHMIRSAPCKCGWQDFECDVGFVASMRNETDGFRCKFQHENRPECATGYRLIPDTKCDLEEGLDLTSTNCPGYSGMPFGITSTTTTDSTSTISTSTTGPSSTNGGTSSKPGSTSSGTPTQTPASSTSTTGSDTKKDGKGGHGGLVAFLVILTILSCVGIAAGVMYKKHEGFRVWVSRKISRQSAHNYGRVHAIEDDDNPFGDD